MKPGRAQQVAFAVIGEFEELLARNNIKLPSDDRQDDANEACIYGSAYYELEDAITTILTAQHGD